MFDDLKALFHENLVALYLRYRSVLGERKIGLSRDLQAATAACLALYHFREHLPRSHAMSRHQIVEICPDFALVGDVANVTKHAHLTKYESKVARAQCISEVLFITEFSDDEGIYTDARKAVVVSLKDGTERDLFEVVTNVINFWGSHLASLGVLESFKPFSLPERPGSQWLLRSETGGLDIESIEGVRFKMQIRLQRFDNLKGYSVPIDLSRSDVAFRIYKQS
jgi:hypothetical protein